MCSSFCASRLQQRLIDWPCAVAPSCLRSIHHHHMQSSASWPAGTALSLTLRYSRTQEGPHYLASVAVIYTEAIKLALCLAAQILQCR